MWSSTCGLASCAPRVEQGRLHLRRLPSTLRCFKDPATIHATCEDYRAGATIDLEHSWEDGTRRVMCPLLVLWGERGTVGRLYDVMRISRNHAVNVMGKALPAGLFLPEEVPDETLSELHSFFTRLKVIATIITSAYRGQGWLAYTQLIRFRCGIIDKTVMYEAAWQKCSRDCSLWVL